jgi:HPt (histidine-containing phosphotransfer) domain-containing protein
MLQRFKDTEANAVDRLNASIAAGDLKTANRIAHTLKGVAGNIGACEVEKLSGMVESLLSNNKIEDAKVVLVGLGDALEHVLASIAKFTPEPAAPVIPVKISARPEEIEVLMDKLATLVEDQSIDAVGVVETLQSQVASDEQKAILKELATTISNYDFEAAVVQLSDLRKAWKT